MMVTIHYQANNICDVVGNNHSDFLSDPSPVIVLPCQSVLHTICQKDNMQLSSYHMYFSSSAKPNQPDS